MNRFFFAASHPKLAYFSRRFLRSRWQAPPTIESRWQPVKSIRTYSSSAAQWRASSSPTDGEEVYQQAMQAMRDAEGIRTRKESERSEKMYEAWAKAQETEKSTKSQGITVVKTLVKETRKEKEREQKESDEEKQALQRATDLLELAALQHHHPVALVHLGNMALERANSSDLKKDVDKRRAEIEKAVDFFQRAGMAGSRVGWYNLGNLLWTGYPASEAGGEEEDGDLATTQEEKIVKPDLHEAMEAFIKAIDLGDTDAMYLVGVHRMTSGGRENIHSGLKLVERAAEEGHGGALYYMALLHLNGEPNVGLEPCTEDEFAKLLDRAVDGGSVEAMFTRGHSYYHGTEGYTQNYQRALHDFLQAADEGHADAAVSAGAMLHTGIGASRDQERAFALYQLAGELGSIDGWKNVVACYTTGEGVPQSLETARYIADTMLKDQVDESII